MDHEVLQVQLDEGEIHVRQGEVWKPDVVFQTHIASSLALLQGRIQPDEVIARGLIRIEGDSAALSRFLTL